MSRPLPPAPVAPRLTLAVKAQSPTLDTTMPRPSDVIEEARRLALVPAAPITL